MPRGDSNGVLSMPSFCSLASALGDLGDQEHMIAMVLALGSCFGPWFTLPVYPYLWAGRNLGIAAVYEPLLGSHAPLLLCNEFVEFISI